jgi:hypothetical protein
MTHKRARARARTTVGRTPLDEGSARHRDLYLATHNTHKGQVIHSPGGIRTRNPSQGAAADLRLRPRGHQDGRNHMLHFIPSLFLVLTNISPCIKPLQYTSQSVRRHKHASLRKCLIACKAVVTNSSAAETRRHNTCSPVITGGSACHNLLTSHELKIFIATCFNTQKLLQSTRKPPGSTFYKILLLAHDVSSSSL